jgi:hypothetical protein
MDMRASILMEVIEVTLCASGFVGVDSPKLGQEFVEDLPAEEEGRGWNMFSVANCSGEPCQIGERCRRSR